MHRLVGCISTLPAPRALPGVLLAPPLHVKETGIADEHRNSGSVPAACGSSELSSSRAARL